MRARGCGGWGECREVGEGVGRSHGGFDLDVGADLKAHRTSGGVHDGVPDDSAYRPATPCDALPGP